MDPKGCVLLLIKKKESRFLGLIIQDFESFAAIIKYSNYVKKSHGQTKHN